MRLNEIQRFDKIVRLTSVIEPLRQQFSGRTTSIEAILSIYQKNKDYDKNKEDALIYLLIDIQLEILYLEDDLRMMGKLISDGFNPVNHDIDNDPTLYIRFFSILQSVIIKSRIVFERIMNYISYYCEGKEIENKSKPKGKKEKFFEKVEKHPQFEPWRFILLLKPIIDKYDEFYRTPETHKKSKLRSFLLDDERRKKALTILPNQLLTIYNVVFSYFWDCLFDVLKNGSVDPHLYENMKKQCDLLENFLSINISTT